VQLGDASTEVLTLVSRHLDPSAAVPAGAALSAAAE
jgi:hypothetical protein